MRLSAISFFLLLLIPALAGAADKDGKPTFIEIKGPQVLAEADDGRVEVISFFWYGCGTCSRIDGAVSQWAAGLPQDVRFIRKHVSFGPPVDVHARIFATLRAMKLSHEADLKVFSLFLGDRKPVNSLVDLPRLAKALNVDEKQLIETFNSKEIDEEMAKLEKLMDAYHIESVPSLVIDGKYLFDIGMVRGPQDFLAQAETLINRQRQARKAAK